MMLGRGCEVLLSCPSQTRNLKVVGSNPIPATKKSAESASLTTRGQALREELE